VAASNRFRRGGTEATPIPAPAGRKGPSPGGLSRCRISRSRRCEGWPRSMGPTTEHLLTSDASSTTGGRFDEAGDWIVRQFLSPADLQVDPDEYVARHAHSLGTFSFHLQRFSDPGLAAWVRRVRELLASEAQVERCRERFLSPDERCSLLPENGKARAWDRPRLGPSLLSSVVYPRPALRRSCRRRGRSRCRRPPARAVARTRPS
jgi:hypothetical protein